MNTPQIAAFARLAKENSPEVRTLQGQKTLISRTMHALAYDSVHDEIVVNSPLAQAILFFRGGAKDEEAPVRVIQGPHTQIQGTDYDGNDKMAFDDVHGEVIIPVAGGKILTFSRESNGDVAPLRVLGGPDTRIHGSQRGHPIVGVDPVHNLLFVSTPAQGRGGQGGALLIFDRTATGNTKPLRVIEGPEVGLGGVAILLSYPPKGWIIGGAAGGGIGAWSINDSGNAPPRWKIPVAKMTGIAPSGVAIDPLHKELTIASGGKNVLMTFSWPEIFE